MKKILCWMLLLALWLAPCALANDYTAISNCDIMRRGYRGENVRRIQQALIDKGYLSGNADGSYGPRTEDAVYEFQRKNGITTSGVATVFTQAKLFSNEAMFAWNNTYLPNYNTGEYGVTNEYGCGEQNDIYVSFDFVNRDSTPVEAICIYYWLADNRNYVVKQNSCEYWIQWYYDMNLPYGASKTVEKTLEIPSNLWRKIDTVRCVVGEIAYNDGTVVVSMNASKAPYENLNYILCRYN